MFRLLLTWLAFLLPALLLCGQAAFLDDDSFIRAAEERLEPVQCDLIVSDSCRVAVCTDQDGEKRLYTHSNDFVQIHGYSGITVLEIVMDETGAIQSVRILESEDTPSFVRHVKHSGFLKNFRNYDGENTPETVTGATITSEAIIETVHDVREKVIRHLKSGLNTNR